MRVRGADNDKELHPIATTGMLMFPKTQPELLSGLVWGLARSIADSL
jgi:ABC-type sulfate transport system permease component